MKAMQMVNDLGDCSPTLRDLRHHLHTLSAFLFNLSQVERKRLEDPNLVKRFRAIYESVCIAAKCAIPFERIAVDVYQEICELEFYDQFLFWAGEEKDEQSTKRNVEALTELAKEMPARLRRLSFRVDAFESLQSGETQSPLPGFRNLPVVQEAIIKVLGEWNTLKKPTAENIVSAIEELNRKSGASPKEQIPDSLRTIRRELSRLKEARLIARKKGLGYILADPQAAARKRR